MNSELNKSNVQEDGQESLIMSGIAWQDSLLQAYRNYLLITQSIFLAVNVGLLSAQASAESLIEKLIFGVPFIVIFILGVATLFHLNRAIKERGQAVDWWQRRLLKIENIRAKCGHFIAFRISKEHGFRPPEVEAHQLDPQEIERLLRAETPKARKVFGLFVPGLAIIWGVLFLWAALNIWEAISTNG